MIRLLRSRRYGSSQSMPKARSSYVATHYTLSLSPMPHKSRVSSQCCCGRETRAATASELRTVYLRSCARVAACMLYTVFVLAPVRAPVRCVCAQWCSRPGELRGGDEKPFAVPPGLRLSTARDRHATYAACARNHQKKRIS